MPDISIELLIEIEGAASIHSWAEDLYKIKSNWYTLQELVKL